MNYKHTQIGYLILAVLVAVVIFYFWLLAIITDEVGYTSAMYVMFFVVFILASFSSLTVMVDEKYLKIKFGYGIFHKKFLLNEIISTTSVKNHWYYGWGIKVWFWPYMWIYNVSGFDAVEIKLKNGKMYRIGTDEPKKLEQTILHLIK